MDVLRPESEHLRHETPELRIVGNVLWEATQRRLVQVSRNTRRGTPSKASKQSVYPTRLFDLYCRYCDKPLWLARTGKYPHMCCLRAKEGSSNCELRTSKSLGIIEDCVLSFVKDCVLDEFGMASLVEQANVFLTEEAAKPTTDTAELRSQIQPEKDNITRQAERLVILGDGVAAATLIKAIAAAENDLKRLETDLAVASSVNFRPEVIDLAAIETMVAELRELLLDDVIRSHDVLSKVLGRVYMTQGPKRGRYYAWIAELNINPMPVFLEVAKKNDCPTKHSLDYLQMRSWTITTPILIEIGERGVHHKIEPNTPFFKPNINFP
jgi:hypothetical protein